MADSKKNFQAVPRGVPCRSDCPFSNFQITFQTLYSTINTKFFYYEHSPTLPTLIAKTTYLCRANCFWEGCGNYTVVHLLDGSHVLLSKNIGLLNSLLPSGAFVRLNKTYIANLKSIKMPERSKNKLLIIKLPNDQLTEVARRRVTLVKNLLTSNPSEKAMQ